MNLKFHTSPWCSTEFKSIFQGSSRMRREYEKSQDLDSMVREEKTGTAGDQLRLFERSLIVSFNFENINMVEKLKYNILRI